MLSEVYTLDKKTLSLDTSKIEKKEVQVQGLELTLDDIGPGIYGATLRVQGYHWKFGNVKT